MNVREMITTERIRKNWQIILLVSVFLIIRARQLFLFHEIVWDEAVYIGIGKYIFSLGDYGLWEEIRPLGLPLLLGAMWKIGLDPVFFGEILSILFAAGCIVLSYKIADRVYNDKRIALASAAIVATFPVFFYNSQFILTDIPSTFFALAAVYFFIKKNYAASGILMSAAAMFRYTYIVIVICLGILAVMQDKRQKKGYAIAVGTIFGIFFMFNLSRYYERGFLSAVFGPLLNASGHQWNIAHAVYGDSFFYTIVNNLAYYPQLTISESPIIVFGAIGIGYMAHIVIREIKGGKLNSVLNDNKFVMSVVALVLIGYFTYITNKQPRFAISFLPYAAIFAAWQISLMLKPLSKTAGVRKTNIIYFAIIAALLVVPVKLNIEQMKWRADVPSEITDNFFMFFSKNELKGRVLTSNPTFAAYSDNYMLGYYDNIYDAEKIYEEKNNNFEMIVFTEDFFPCIQEIEKCNDIKKEIIEDISRKQAILSKEHKGMKYIIARNLDGQIT